MIKLAIKKIFDNASLVRPIFTIISFELLRLAMLRIVTTSHLHKKVQHFNSDCSGCIYHLHQFPVK